MIEKKEILRVLVGSWAHGLAEENSDKDYRAVYVLPTTEILSIGYKYKGTDWIEGVEDNTSYEIGHFLQLATKCNPTILEVFKAPIIYANEDGYKLRELFTYVWNPIDAFNAFVGYGLNQRKKFLDKKDNRQNKYAAAYIRTLCNLIELLQTGSFSIEIPNESQIKKDLLRYKKGDYKVGEVIQHAEDIITDIKIILENPTVEWFHSKQKPNINKVNEFLIEIRKKYWNERI